VSHVFREASQVVDDLTKFGLNIVVSYFHVVPCFIAAAVIVDNAWIFFPIDF